MAKNIVYYTYLEVIINTKGEIKKDLTTPKNVVLTKEFLPNSPKITSKILSEKLVGVLNKNQKWTIKKITN